jgi:GH25 family lysozyme M1 (1,4-beta-N-acetylmuramidase)
MDSSGRMKTGWVKSGGKWYYMNSEGKMRTGWVKSGGKWYYMDSSGAMVTGYRTIKDVTYLFTSSGALKTGWVEVDGTMYYFDEDGTLLKGEQEIDGYQYRLDAVTGAMKTGWLKLDSKWYYYTDEGKMAVGFEEVKGKIYYFNQDGVMQTGQVKIPAADNNGVAVTAMFRKDGSMLTKSGKYNGVYYQIDPETYNIIHQQKLFSDKIYLEGIDISEHNGLIDLTKYQDGFVIIRVSWDTDMKDKRAVRNMDLCEKLKIPYGVYVYSYAMNEKQAKQEAEYALKLIEGRKFTLGVWFDMEDVDTWKKRHGFSFTQSNITKICYAFCNTVKDAGYYCGIYASYSWFAFDKSSNNYIYCPDIDKWVAHWGENNDGTYSSDMRKYGVMHQYSSTPLDKDVLYQDLSYFEQKTQEAAERVSQSGE